jgi:hypothetical protein
MFAFTGGNRFISMESVWKHFKNSKTIRDTYLCLHLSIHIRNNSIHLVTQSTVKTIATQGNKHKWKTMLFCCHWNRLQPPLPILGMHLRQSLYLQRREKEAAWREAAIMWIRRTGGAPQFVHFVILVFLLSFMEPRHRFQGIFSANLHSLADRYDNPFPTRFLAPIDCLKIPAQMSNDFLYLLLLKSVACNSIISLFKFNLFLIYSGLTCSCT